MKVSERRADLKQTIRDCTDCKLHKVGHGPVPFFGKPSKIMVVAEAPGRREDELGRPLVGPSGKKLWEELGKVGIGREDVIRANAVCCYPQRTPTDDEIWACRGNLHRQVLICDPHWILALGRVANQSLGNRGNMAKIHGKWYDQRLVHMPAHRIKVLATYHPSAVLRDRTLTRVWREDLTAFAERVNGAA